MAPRKKIWPTRLRNYLLCVLIVNAFSNIAVLAPSLDVDYSFVGTLTVRLINGVMSTPIRFLYSDFVPVDRLFCKYTNTTQPFAAFRIPLGSTTPVRVLVPVSTQYGVVNTTIGTSGYFGIKIVGNVDRDDEKSIICQFSTKFTIGSSTTILLKVIAPVKITPFMNPRNPSLGDSVEAGCIIEGYPFPIVEISTPKNYMYSSTQVSNSSTKLTAYKYSVKIPTLESSWDGERIYCSAFQIGGPSRSSYVTIRSRGSRSLLTRNPVLVTGLAIGGTIALGVLILIAVLVLIFYRRRVARRRSVANRFDPRGVFVASDNGPSISDSKPENYFPPREEFAGGNIEGRIVRENELVSNSYEVSTAAFV